MVTNDRGVTMYMYSPQMGTTWLKITSEAAPTGQPMDATAIQESFDDPPEGVTYNCRVIGDIPDSDFAPPAGAQVQDMSALTGGV
jgi:hypothetical protein